MPPPSPPQGRPLVFRYLSYRSFLSEWLRWLRSQNRIKTKRWFARKIGVSSGHLVNVLHGQRELSESMLRRMLPHMSLSADERDYLIGLVALKGSSDPNRRREILRTLFENPSWQRTVNIGAQEQRYISSWLLVVLREMATQTGFRTDPAWIQERLVFPASLAEIRAAAETLARLGLIPGEERPHDAMMTTSQDEEGDAVYQYHRDMLALAQASLDDTPYEQRMLAGVTLSLTPEMRARFRVELFALIQQMAEEAELARATEHGPADVYQVSAQIFPLALAVAHEE